MTKTTILMTLIIATTFIILLTTSSAYAFPANMAATAFPNANGVGSHGVAVDSAGDVWYVNVGSGLIRQDPSFAPGDALGILFKALPHPVVNVAIDNQDKIWMSGSTGRIIKYDPVADSFTTFGPVVGCSFLDHIHFHSDGFVYTTCLDGNHILAQSSNYQQKIP